MNVPIPARPITGGDLLTSTMPLIGKWLNTAKYNGWRMVLQIDGYIAYNRHQEKLSIASEFRVALAKLDAIKMRLNGFTDWLDAEALERRHELARGTILIIDYIPRRGDRTNHEDRIAKLRSAGIKEAPLDPREWEADAVYLVRHNDDAKELYNQTISINRQIGVELYEGVVIKQANSQYPASSNRDFPMWIKFRHVQPKKAQ
jgi:ATP-dependent DNA ligase